LRECRFRKMPHVELPQAEFKVVLLGDTNTGKTSLVLRFCEGVYKEKSNTVGAFFLTKRVTVPTNITCKLLLWDTAGQRPFWKLARTYYEKAAAAILTFDVSQPQSLHRVHEWLQELDRQRPSIIKCICACKTDLDSTLHHPGIQDQARELAELFDCLYFATSSKTGDQVSACMEGVASKVWQAQEQGTPDLFVTVGGMVPRVESMSPVPVGATATAGDKPALATAESSSESDDALSQSEKKQVPKSQDIMCDGIMSCSAEERGCCIM